MITNKIPKESMMENIEKENETKNNKRILKLILGIGLIVVLVAVTVFNGVGMCVEQDNTFIFENTTILTRSNHSPGSERSKTV